MWKNETGKKIFADSNNEIVEEGSPYAAVLVADVDASIKMSDAKKYGLTSEGDEPKPAPAKPAVVAESKPVVEDAGGK